MNSEFNEWLFIKMDKTIISLKKIFLHSELEELTQICSIH